MSPELFAQKMREALAQEQPENHIQADAILCAQLLALGYGEAIDLYEEAQDGGDELGSGFWYE